MVNKKYLHIFGCIQYLRQICVSPQLFLNNSNDIYNYELQQSELLQNMLDKKYYADKIQKFFQNPEMNEGEHQHQRHELT